MRILPAVLLCLALAAPVAAQHDHMGTAAAIIAHDTPTDGRTYAGDVTSFAVVDDANHDLQPDTHQNNHIRVSLNGAVLWEASADAGHDYDGVNTFSIVFPTTGTYEVALVADDGSVQAHYDGTVEAPHAPAAATVQLDVPATAVPLKPVAIGVRIDAGGQLVDHSDAIVEVREGDDLVFRTHAHTHTEPMALEYAFARPGTYVVRATGYLAYATGKGMEFAPMTSERTVVVAPDTSASGLPAAQPQVPAPPMPVPGNKVVTGTTQGGSYQFFGTYDPYTAGSPGTQMHLTGLVMDPQAMMPVQHVNFQATLTGPLGTVFTSRSLHEYDGIYELVAKEPIPGSYLLSLDAQKGNWTGHLDLPYTIALNPPLPDPSAPAPPPLVGGVQVSLDGAQAAAGKAATLTLAAKDAAGSPYQHSELDVEVVDANGNPLLWTKLHTHGSGLFPLTYAFPSAGDYQLRVAPNALDGLPANFAAAGGAAQRFHVAVGPGPGLPTLAIAPTGQDAATHAAPGAGILLAAGLLGLAFLRRRLA